MPAGICLDEMFGPEIERYLRVQAGPANLTIVGGRVTRPAVRDSAVLAFAAARRLALVTRNVTDFLRLNEQWTALRDWGLLPQPHAGILIAVGRVPDHDWADLVLKLLLHPRCPVLDDQVLLWPAAVGRWETDHPYARQRRRPVRL
jgi:hypothetical protein